MEKKKGVQIGPNYSHEIKMAYAGMKAARIPMRQIRKALKAMGHEKIPSPRLFRMWDKMHKDVLVTPDDELADDKLEIKSFILDTKRSMRDIISANIDQIREQEVKRDMKALDDKDYQNVKLKVLKLASDVVYQEERLAAGITENPPIVNFINKAKMTFAAQQGAEDGTGPDSADPGIIDMGPVQG